MIRALVVGKPDGDELIMGPIVAHPEGGLKAERASLGGEEKVAGHVDKSQRFSLVRGVCGHVARQRNLFGLNENTQVTTFLPIDSPIWGAVMITPEQSRAARGWLNWSQKDLAKRANVSLFTVRDFGNGRRKPIGNNLVTLQSALEVAGVKPVARDGHAVGIEAPNNQHSH